MRGVEGGTTGLDDSYAARAFEGVGASIMGRNMFSPLRGPWANEDWKGWWGDTPPFKHPVFVLTHHPREPLVKEGGTTFTFVNGFDAALELAQAAAGEKDVHVAGGAEAVQQALASGALDELQLHVAPVLLGGGTKLFADGAEASVELTRVASSPAAAHLTYSVSARA